MKTIVTLVTAGIMALGLAACSGSEEANVVDANVAADAGLGSEDDNLSIVDDNLTADNAGFGNDTLGAPIDNAVDLNASVDGNAAGNAL